MEVSNQIIQVLDNLCEKFGVAVDWTSDNVIPYIETLCKKLVAHEIATSIATIAFWLIVSIVSIIAATKLYPIFKNGIEKQGYFDNDWTPGAVFAVTGLVIINVVSVIAIWSNILDIIKCITFPEMYVLDYITDLLKEVK